MFSNTQVFIRFLSPYPLLHHSWWPPHQLSFYSHLLVMLIHCFVLSHMLPLVLKALYLYKLSTLWNHSELPRVCFLCHISKLLFISLLENFFYLFERYVVVIFFHLPLMNVKLFLSSYTVNKCLGWDQSLIL